MNGIHDLGGLTCFGPVLREHDEPVFHEDWERRVFAMMNLGAIWLGPIDAMRHAIERMEPMDYLATTYYEHWLAALETRLVDRNLAALDTPPAPLDAAVIASLVAGGAPATRDEGPAPRFRVGDEVLTRNLNPSGHTRLPRYVRGRRGVIHGLHGNHVYPDTAAHDAGEHPHPLYSVRFSARELWGDDAGTRDSLYIDLWEDYLEPASS